MNRNIKSSNIYDFIILNKYFFNLPVGGMARDSSITSLWINFYCNNNNYYLNPSGLIIGQLVFLTFSMGFVKVYADNSYEKINTDDTSDQNKEKEKNSHELIIVQFWTFFFIISINQLKNIIGPTF